MAKPNDTSNPEVTESSPRFVPLLPHLPGRHVSA